MVTSDSVKAKLQGLISRANGVTGNADATLTQAVEALIAGFGQGGSTVQTGSFTPAENISSISLTVNGTCSNLALWRISSEMPGTVRLLQRYVEIDRSHTGDKPFYHTLASNGTGTTLNASAYNDIGNAVFEAGTVSLSFNADSYGWGWLVAGYTYVWMAW